MKLEGAHPDTVLAHTGTQAATGHVTAPIAMSTTFARGEDNALLAGVDYARDGSPAYLDAEATLARLEGGSRALVFASGMAAATAVFMSLEPGAHVVVPSAMYWALKGWILRWATGGRLDVDVVDSWDTDALFAAVRRGKTRLIWLETPANPTWEVSDISAAAEIARAAGALLAVDSTAATPLITRPLELGAEIVMHSASKYLNGHSDVIAGALVTKDVSPLWQRIALHRRGGGAILGPFEAWLLARGMRTLAVRVQRQSRTALALARWLEAQPSVTRVRYPGLPSHPQHDVAARQMRGGFGGMLSIHVKGGAEGALSVASRARVFIRATSLGGTESLIEHRATAEGEGSVAPPDLLRLSIGLEDEADLLADLERALA